MDLVLEHKVDQLEAFAYDACIPEQPLYLTRRCACGYIKVLGYLTDHQVAHRSPYKVSFRSRLLKFLNRPYSIPIYEGIVDLMFFLRVNICDRDCLSMFILFVSN